MKRSLLTVLTLALLCTGPMFAQRKAVKRPPCRTPNLNAAERFSNQAHNKIVAAQRDNEWDLAGHAAKAKNLLEQAKDEMQKAADVKKVNCQPD